MIKSAMPAPDELKALKFPTGWGAWSILSGKELDLPRGWAAPLKAFLKAQEPPYLLEVKLEGDEKSVILEVQEAHNIPDEQLGLLKNIRVPVPVKLTLRFDAQNALTDASKAAPAPRDLKVAGRHVLNLIANGTVDLPGEPAGDPKPWRVVQDEDGGFRLERAFLA